MYKSVSLGALQNFQNFLLCDVMAFSCFYQIICHITDTDAQISFDFAAAFAAHALLTAAGTGADCIFVLIFFSQWEICSTLADSCFAGIAFLQE